MSVARFSCSYLMLPLLGSLLLVAPSCTDDTDDLTLVHQESIQVSQQNRAIYPEGVVFDEQNNSFLVGSQTLGSIGRVSDYGNYEVLTSDPSLISSIGLKVDAAGDRLLVAVADPGYNTARSSSSTLGKTARVVVLNSNTGVRIASLSLDERFRKGTPHYANDIALDAAGNAYVTDSYAPFIYRISSQNGVSLFKQDTLFAPSAPNVIGLNGIACNPKGFVLTVRSDTGTLLKIPISTANSVTTGGTVTKVTTDQDLTGGDGMQFLNDSTLLMVLNKQNKVVRLHSSDDWTTAVTTGTFETPNVYPTALTQRTVAEPYVLYSNLNALLSNQQPPVTTFIIQKLRF